MLCLLSKAAAFHYRSRLLLLPKYMQGYYCYLNICTCNLKPCYEMSREKKKEEKVFGYYKNVDFTATLVKVHVMTNSCKSMVFFTRNFLLYCHKSQSLFSLQDQF